MSGPSAAAVPPVTVLILAASRGPADPVARFSGVSHKCLVPIAGQSMLARVLDTLSHCPSLGQLAIVVDEGGREPVRGIISAVGVAADRCRVLPSAASPAESVRSAIASQEAPFPLLITTADSPLMTVEMVEHFCAASRETGADLTAGLAEGKLILQYHPEAKRTFLRFQDGRFSGCNLFFLQSPKALKAIAYWQQAERYRKKPWRLVAAFGLRPLLAFLFGRLTLRAAFEHASARLGVKIREIVLPYPTAALDVDKPADLELAESIIRAR